MSDGNDLTPEEMSAFTKDVRHLPAIRELAEEHGLVEGLLEETGQASVKKTPVKILCGSCGVVQSGEFPVGNRRYTLVPAKDGDFLSIKGRHAPQAMDEIKALFADGELIGECSKCESGVYVIDAGSSAENPGGLAEGEAPPPLADAPQEPVSSAMDFLTALGMDPEKFGR